MADDEVKSIVTLKIESGESDPVRAAIEALSLLRLGAITAPLVEVETLADPGVYAIDVSQPRGRQIVGIYLPLPGDDDG